MATNTFGTASTTSCTALQFSPGSMLQADVATIQQIINNDALTAGVSQDWPGAFSTQGQLFIPNRGLLILQAGDWVVVDPNTGWPFVVPASLASNTAGWIHS